MGPNAVTIFKRRQCIPLAQPKRSIYGKQGQRCSAFVHMMVGTSLYSISTHDSGRVRLPEYAAGCVGSPMQSSGRAMFRTP